MRSSESSAVIAALQGIGMSVSGLMFRLWFQSGRVRQEAAHANVQFRAVQEQNPGVARQSGSCGQAVFGLNAWASDGENRR